ncbi:MAG: multidrug ABC transporter permease [Ignavibacteria bacterium]
MKIPLKYTLRNLETRRLTTALTIFGITLVVFVFAAVLMMAHGVERTLVATGSDENILISRKAANGEIASLLDGETINIILSMSHIARTASGTPLATKDVATVINLPKTDHVGITNVTVRGVSPEAFILRPHVKIVEGRMFTWGAREVIIGRAVARRILGATIGSTIKFGGNEWRVVGTFEADGSGFESEIWGDGLQVTEALGRSNTFSTLTLRLGSPQDYDAFMQAFTADPRLQQFIPKTERKFFEEQSETMALFIRVLGIFITVIFSAGAVIGAMITMYGAVANRTVEIGTLRALGFPRRSVLGTYLVESLILALVGGVIGLVLASFLQFFKVSTINFDSFAEIEFAFALSPNIVVASLIFSAVMGVVGGFLPSVRAARLNIVLALRGA